MILESKFAIEFIENRIQNILSNEEFDEKTKGHIIKELNHIKHELFNKDADDTIWTYKISIIDDGSKYVFFEYNIPESNIDVDTSKGIVTVFNDKKNTIDVYPLNNIKFIKKKPYTKGE